MTPSLPPYEIRLVVQPDLAAESPIYLAHWQNAAGQPVTQVFPLVPPLISADLKDLRWYLEEYMQFPGAGDRARAAKIEPRLRAWGQALCNAAFSTPDARQIYAHMQQAETSGRLCRVTIGCDVPLVLQQPWELMHDGRGPLTFHGITVRRQLPESQDTLLPLYAAPLRVLLIVSRPEDVGFIDARTSVRPLLEAVSALPPGLVQIESCEPPTFARLEELIGQARRKNRPYHIVHFDGHGTYLPQTGVGALVFEDAHEHHELVSGRRLGDLLSRLQVPLVILEACRSADLSAQSSHDSVAPALLQAGVGSVIAFSHSVHVEAARLLVERFYRELAAGRTVGQALEEARVRLHTERTRWLVAGPDAETIELEDWFIPQLYQVGADPALLTAGATPAGAAPALTPLDTQWMHGFPPPPRYQFQGRARELLRLERDLRVSPAVLLTGMGGTGKTALAREAAAWWLRTGRFEEAVFVSLEQRPPAERVVQLIGETLNGARFSAKGASDQWRWVVQAFRTGRVLVVWDNFESVLPQFQAGPENGLLCYNVDDLARLRRLYTELTAPGAQGRLLITSRQALLDWPGLKLRPLRGLARTDSQYILRSVLERHAEERVPQYDRAELDDLITLLGDHPLSLELVGPHLVRRSPAAVKAEFRDLLDEFASDAPDEERNRSLRASLAFSLRRLSEGARTLLPWLAWFSGGVFEDDVQAFAELTPEAWEPLRAELVGTALVRLELVPGFEPCYLHLHPTLPYAVAPEAVPDPDVAEQRFIGVYYMVMREAGSALQGQNPAFGMALLQYEEANYRAALERAFRRGERQAAWALVDTLRLYLEWSGRLIERDRLVEWAFTKLSDGGGLDSAICANTRDYAWTLLTQGHTAQAVEILHRLLVRLNQEGLADMSDPANHQALTLLFLGRVYLHSGRPAKALNPLQRAVDHFQQLGNNDLGNLAAALGDLASAKSHLGELTAALFLAEQALAIKHRLGHVRDVAVNLGRIATIMVDQQRYTEADERFSEALAAARQAGDQGLEALMLQHRSRLQYHLGNHDQAIQLLQNALRLFQQAGNAGEEIHTSDALGTIEVARGNLDAAEAWYIHAGELARQRNDRRQLGATAHNLGGLYQARAEQELDAARRTSLLRQAVISMQESLQFAQEREDQVYQANSLHQLGVVHYKLGDLTQAEQELRQAIRIRETLDLPDVYEDYGALALVIYAQGNMEAAAQWWARREAKEAELVRQRGEGGQLPPLVSLEPLLRAIAAVARGDMTQRERIEGLFPQMRAEKWGAMPNVIQRIWQGERNLDKLVSGLVISLVAVVARILQLVADPEVPPLPSESSSLLFAIANTTTRGSILFFTLT